MNTNKVLKFNKFALITGFIDTALQGFALLARLLIENELIINISMIIEVVTFMYFLVLLVAVITTNSSSLVELQDELDKQKQPAKKVSKKTDNMVTMTNDAAGVKNKK